MHIKSQAIELPRAGVIATTMAAIVQWQLDWLVAASSVDLWPSAGGGQTEEQQLKLCAKPTNQLNSTLLNAASQSTSSIAVSRTAIVLLFAAQYCYKKNR